MGDDAASTTAATQLTEVGEDQAGTLGTRRRKRQYRRKTGREMREGIRAIRDADRANQGKKPTLATRIRERGRSAIAAPQEAGAPLEAQPSMAERRIERLERRVASRQPARRRRSALPEVSDDDLTLNSQR